jgi:hypothetical protein
MGCPEMGEAGFGVAAPAWSSRGALVGVGGSLSLMVYAMTDEVMSKIVFNYSLTLQVTNQKVARYQYQSWPPMPTYGGDVLPLA